MLYTFSMITLAISLNLLWFFFVVYLGKKIVGKEASGRSVIFFLMLSGPVGWAILLIALVTDIVEKFTK